MSYSGIDLVKIFDLTEENLALRWRQFWIIPLLEKNIILCDICKNVIPDKKNSPNGQIEMKLPIILKVHFHFQQALCEPLICCHGV